MFVTGPVKTNVEVDAPHVVETLAVFDRAMFALAVTVNVSPEATVTVNDVVPTVSASASDPAAIV